MASWTTIGVSVVTTAGGSTPMTPSDRISLAAVAVAGVSVVVTGLVGPWLGGRRERERRIGEERGKVYADAIRLVRDRIQETESNATGPTPRSEHGPSDAEVESILAGLLLYAPRPLWEKFERSITTYNRTFLPRLHSDVASGKGGDDLVARLTISDAAERMKVLLDEMLALMRKDIGIHN